MKQKSKKVSEDSSPVFVQIGVNQEDRIVNLLTSNMTRVRVPFSFFATRPNGPVPDFTKCVLEDDGQTVRLGQYEATADVILYTFDSKYRKENL